MRHRFCFLAYIVSSLVAIYFSYIYLVICNYVYNNHFPQWITVILMT